MAVTGRQTAILLFGMHRSGTSAATRVLNLLGAELNSKVLEANFANRKGYWESAEAVDLHDRLLREFSRSWNDVRQLPAGWMQHPAAEAALADIIALIERDFSGKALWVVKDPRMCRLAPLWLKALDALGIEAKALFVVRDPLEVAGSLLARDHMSLGHAAMMWVQHLADPERATRDYRRAMITYDQLLKDWRSTMTRVARELDVVWPNALVGVEQVVDDFLDKGERHHSGGTRGTASAQPGLPSTVVDMYQACLRITDGGADWRRLGELTDGFDRVAGLFGAALDGAFLESADVRQQSEVLQAHIESRNKEVEAYARQADEYDRLLREAHGRIEQLTAEGETRCVSLSAQVELRAKEVEAYAKQAAEYDQLLKEANQRIEQLAAESEARHASLGAQGKPRAEEVEAYAKQAAEYDQLLKEANRRLVQLAAESEARCASLGAQVELRAKEIEAYAKQAAEYDQLLKEANRHIEQLTAEGEARCASFGAQVELRAKEIEAYAKQAAEYDQLLRKANRRIEEIDSEYESQLALLNAQNESKEQEVEVYARQARAHDSLLRTANRRIGELEEDKRQSTSDLRAAEDRIQIAEAASQGANGKCEDMAERLRVLELERQQASSIRFLATQMTRALRERLRGR